MKFAVQLARYLIPAILILTVPQPQALAGPKTVEVEIDGKKEERILRDCGKEIKYQSRAFGFKLKILDKLEISGESEAKKVYEASEKLQLLQKLSSDLCRDWNAGIIKQEEEYLKRANEIRQRFLDFDSLAEGIKKKTLEDPEVLNQFLGKLDSWNASTNQLLDRLQKIEEKVDEMKENVTEVKESVTKISRASELANEKLDEIVKMMARAERRQIQESKEKPAEEIIVQMEALKTKVAGLELENAKLRVKNAANSSAKGKEFLAKGQYREAVEAFRDSAVDYEQALVQLPEESRAAGSVYYNLGLAYTHLFLWEDAEKAYLQAAKIQEQAGEIEDLALTYNNLGHMSITTSNYSSAEEYLRKCLEVVGPIKLNKVKANALGNMGIVYHFQGKLEEALKTDKESLKISRQIGFWQGEVSNLNNMGIIYRSQGKPEEALKAFEEAYGIFSANGITGGMEWVKTNIEELRLMIKRD